MKYLYKLYVKNRFGRLSYGRVVFVEGYEAEYEVLDRNNKVVGYWAYGHYDTRLPYRGQDEDSQIRG